MHRASPNNILAQPSGFENNLHTFASIPSSFIVQATGVSLFLAALTPFVLMSATQSNAILCLRELDVAAA